MLHKKMLADGRIEITSDTGLVDIGNGAVKTIIVTKDEEGYVEEVQKHEHR